MTQKEFLEAFIDYGNALGYESAYDQRDFLDKFLEYHHKEYFEVEHIRKNNDEQISDDENRFRMESGLCKLI